MNDFNRAKNTSELDKFIGARVRLARSAAGLTQTRLAERLGITFQQVQKYEGGTNRVSASRLLLIAAILGVPVDYFYDGLGEGLDAAPGRASLLSDIQASPQCFRLVLAFNRIEDGEQRRAVLGLVLALAGEAAAEETPADRDAITHAPPAGRGGAFPAAALAEASNG